MKIRRKYIYKAFAILPVLIVYRNYDRIVFEIAFMWWFYQVIFERREGA